MASIFKAYDIRGVYGDTLTAEMARGIGRAYATFLKCRRVVVGQDMRPHSEPLALALIDGLTQQGADVIRVGQCSTPMSYYANGKLGADGSIMITASHNTGEWNGFKLCREMAIPISGATGILDIERIFGAKVYAAPAAKRGLVSRYDIVPEYCAHVRAQADIRRPVRIAVDFANGMGILEAESLKGLVEIDPMFDTLDGTFPNHEANPLKTETLDALRERVRSGRYDFGVAFDGDADRAGFVDERGEIIAMDLTTALVAQDILKHRKGTILYDLRSSWTVKEVIRENGGTPLMSKVGHSFIKQQMRDADALFAGELSGHYYFRVNYFTESSAMAILSLAAIVSASDRPISELLKPLRRYADSGEINSHVKDPASVLDAIRARYRDGRQMELDGVTVEYDDWWFNVRCSNTEPLVRLNLEARTQQQMERKRDEVLAVIQSR